MEEEAEGCDTRDDDLVVIMGDESLGLYAKGEDEDPIGLFSTAEDPVNKDPGLKRWAYFHSG